VRNAAFTLILGLMVGFGIGFVVGERQPIKPVRAVEQPTSGRQAALPEGHPPIGETGSAPDQADRLTEQAQQLMARLAQTPDDPQLMVALGNVYYDSKRWSEARTWYEKALEQEPDNPDVVTDLAVVYRNLSQPEKSIELLDQAIALRADHWQAWHNKAVIFHFDLHRDQEAAQALERLAEIRASNPNMPDFTDLEAAVRSALEQRQ